MAGWTLEQTKTWWLEYREPRVSGGTLTAEKYRLNPLIRTLGNVLLKQITNLEIDRYVTKRLGEGIGAWSVNKEIMVWSMILKKAKLWRRIADDYKPLKTRASDIGRALTRDELRQLAETAATDQDWEAAFYGSCSQQIPGSAAVKSWNIGSCGFSVRSQNPTPAPALSSSTVTPPKAQPACCYALAY
jgi:hypothetical protein